MKIAFVKIAMYGNFPKFIGTEQYTQILQKKLHHVIHAVTAISPSKKVFQNASATLLRNYGEEVKKINSNQG